MAAFYYRILALDVSIFTARRCALLAVVGACQMCVYIYCIETAKYIIKHFLGLSSINSVFKHYIYL